MVQFLVLWASDVELANNSFRTLEIQCNILKKLPSKDLHNTELKETVFRLLRPYNFGNGQQLIAWRSIVFGSPALMFLKVNRAYHKFGAWLRVKILPLGSHESKPHISRFGRRTMQTNSNQSIRAVVAVRDKTAPSHHRLYGLIYTATFARKTQRSQNSIEVLWEKAQKVASLRHGLRKWRHLYFSREFLVRFVNQAARTSRFKGTQSAGAHAH